MTDPTLAWTLWDLLSALVVVVVLTAPLAAVAAGVFYAVKWWRGRGENDSRSDVQPA
jgi:hypothetical protein